MASFQKIIIGVALVILLIVLVMIAVVLYYSKSNEAWPPVTSNCPDYWSFDGSGNCVNVKHLGTCDKDVMDFNSSIFTGSSGNCNKYKWAKKCDISWDGINYGVDNPCNG